MAVITVDLRSDVTEFKAAMQELQGYFARAPKLLFEAFNRAFGLDLRRPFESGDLAAKLWKVEAGPAPVGTLLVLLQPSDRLAEFLAAARAGDLQRKFVD